MLSLDTRVPGALTRCRGTHRIIILIISIIIGTSSSGLFLLLFELALKISDGFWGFGQVTSRLIGVVF